MKADAAALKLCAQALKTSLWIGQIGTGLLVGMLAGLALAAEPSQPNAPLSLSYDQSPDAQKSLGIAALNTGSAATRFEQSRFPQTQHPNSAPFNPQDRSPVFGQHQKAGSFEPAGVNLLNLKDSQGSFRSLGGNSNRLIGREILRLINQSGERLGDPWVDAQLTQMFSRFASYAGLEQTLGAVMIEDPSINAFAVPGALVGFHTGLILEAESLDEVAGVMAHETAHLAQNHFGRRSEAQRYDWLVQTLGLLSAALIGGGSEASSALAIGSQALIADRALSFSRAQESEADRVGLNLMRQSEYDAAGMPGFFEKLLQIANREDKVTAFLRSHPLSSTRVSDIRARKP